MPLACGTANEAHVWLGENVMGVPSGVTHCLSPYTCMLKANLPSDAVPHVTRKEFPPTAVPVKGVVRTHAPTSTQENTDDKATSNEGYSVR